MIKKFRLCLLVSIFSLHSLLPSFAMNNVDQERGTLTSKKDKESPKTSRDDQKRNSNTIFVSPKKPVNISTVQKIINEELPSRGVTKQKEIIGILSPTVDPKTNPRNILDAIRAGTRKDSPPEECIKNYLEWVNASSEELKSPLHKPNNNNKTRETDNKISIHPSFPSFAMDDDDQERVNRITQKIANSREKIKKKQIKIDDLEWLLNNLRINNNSNNNMLPSDDDAFI